MAFSLVYFVLNTVLATMVIHLKRNQPMVLREVLANFGWVALAYAGSATVATLLFLTVGQSGPGVLMAVVPMVGLLLATLHFFFRQQEADEAMRRSRVEAAEREPRRPRCTQALAVSEQRFHSAFTHAAIGMALVSADGEVRQVNVRSARCWAGRGVAASAAPRRAGARRRREHAGRPAGLRAPPRDRRLRQRMRCRHHGRQRRVGGAGRELLRRPGRRGLQPDRADAGHHGAPQRRGAPAAHRLPRQPDGPAEPRARFHEHLAQAIETANGDLSAASR